MDLKKLVKLLHSLGGLIIVGAIAWWAYFYSQVVSGSDANLGDAIVCLISNAGSCGLISGLARLGGIILYSPIALWAGIGIYGIGLIMRASLNDE